MNWLHPGRWLLYAAAAAAMAIGYGAWLDHIRDQGRAEIQAKWDTDRLQWQATLASQKAEAASTLAVAEAKARDTETRMRAARDAQERTDAKNRAAVADLTRRLAAVSLRDPGPTPQAPGRGGGGAAPAAEDPTAPHPGGADPAQAGRLLSAELAGLLRRLTADADAINDAYASCRSDAVSIRSQGS